MRYLLAIPCTCLLLVVSGHTLRSADNPEADPGSLKTDAEYFPLKLGTTWTYREKASNQTYIVKVIKYEDIKVSKGSEDIKVRCAVLETTAPKKPGPLGTELIGVSDDGVYRYKISDYPVEPPARILASPLKKGDTWKIESKIQSETVQLEYAADEVEVKVPADKYTAMRLKANDFNVEGEKMEATVWFVKGIGMVKLEMKVNGVPFTLELEKFEAGK
jgi:hypothetical protein